MKTRLFLAASALVLAVFPAPAPAQQMSMPGMQMPKSPKKTARKAIHKGTPRKHAAKKQSAAKRKAAAAKKTIAHNAHRPTSKAALEHKTVSMPMPAQSQPATGAMPMSPSQMQSGTTAVTTQTPMQADGPSQSTMSMAMPGGTVSNNGAMVRLNQFMLYSHTSGPRGQSRVTGPGMWMLMYDSDLSSRNHLSVDVMGTPEHLTVGDKGTPQLLQTENIDAMHPHDYIMALELRDSLTLDAAKNERLTFLFAPRGEAAIGPVPFMHRESAEGNPDAPLGHALQDGFHDVSTVLGVEYQFARTTIETTAFSGRDIVWPLPLHRPDSYAVRVTQKIDNHLSLGASYADALLPSDSGGSEHNHFVAAWLSASYLVGHNTLKSSLVWGRGRAVHGPALNSVLEEAVFQAGPNKFYNRAEILQITPAQLDLPGSEGAAKPEWAGALTVGYERTLFEKSGLALFAGGSYTKDFIPTAFEGAYGSDPGGEKVYLRLAFHGGTPAGAARRKLSSGMAGSKDGVGKRASAEAPSTQAIVTSAQHRPINNPRAPPL